MDRTRSGGDRVNPEDLLERLVQIPSPTGEEPAAVRFLQTQARQDGFRVIEDSAGNFVADAGSGRALLLFVGHIDTVPGRIPVRVENGQLWGRGAVDAKGSLVAFYEAARSFLRSPEVRLRVVGAVDEEGLSRGAKALPSQVAPDAIVIGEPSGINAIAVGYKGVVRGTFRVRRPRIHGAHPGLSAPDQTLDFWSLLRTELGVDPTFHGIQVRLESLATVTDNLEDEVDARFSVRVPWDRAAHDVAARLEALGRAHDVHMELREVLEPAQGTRGNPLVAAYQQAVREAGLALRFTRKSGTSDFNTLHAAFPHTPIVAYGPGDPSLDHTPNERLPLVDLRRAIDVHRAAIAHWTERLQARDRALRPTVAPPSRRRAPKTPI